MARRNTPQASAIGKMVDRLPEREDRLVFMEQEVQRQQPLANLLPVPRGVDSAQGKLDRGVLRRRQPAWAQESPRVNNRLPRGELEIHQVAMVFDIVEYTGLELDEFALDPDFLPIFEQAATGDARCFVRRMSEDNWCKLRSLLVLF